MSNEPKYHGPVPTAETGRAKMAEGLSKDIRKIRDLLGQAPLGQIINGGADRGRQPLNGNSRQQDVFEDTGMSERYNNFMTNGMTPVVVPDSEYQIIVVMREGSGDDLYQVRRRDGTKAGPAFRRESDAKLLAAFLNETRSLNDPRASRLIELTEQENNILKARAKVVREYKGSSDQKKRSLLEKEANSLKRQLNEVRVKLGVND